MSKKMVIFGPWCGEFCYELSWWIPEIRVINQYFEDDKYIEALSNSVSSFWEKHSKPQKIIFS